MDSCAVICHIRRRFKELPYAALFLMLRSHEYRDRIAIFNNQNYFGDGCLPLRGISLPLGSNRFTQICNGPKIRFKR